MGEFVDMSTSIFLRVTNVDILVSKIFGRYEHLVFGVNLS